MGQHKLQNLDGTWIMGPLGHTSFDGEFGLLNLRMGEGIVLQAYSGSQI